MEATEVLVYVTGSPGSGGAPPPGLLQSAREWDIELVAVDADALFARQGACADQVQPLVVVFATDVPAPVELARLSHAVYPKAHTVFVAGSTSDPVFRERLQRALLIGPHWSVVSSDPGKIVTAVADAMRATRQRLRLRTTLDVLNRRIEETRATVDHDAQLRRLVASDRYLATLLSHVTDAVIALDSRGDVIGWSKGAEELFGLPAETAIGRPGATLSGGEWPEVFPALLEVARSRRSPGPREVRGERANGEVFYVRLVLAPVEDGDENEFSIAALGSDVTAAKLASEERARHARELELRNQELDSFAYTVSHDLRAPLRAIGLLANWVIEESAGTLSPQASQRLYKLRQRVTYMHSLLDDLLTYCRTGRAATEATCEEVDTGALARAEFHEIAPPPAFALTVAADMPLLWTPRVPLQQVLRNLIANAIQHHDRADGRVSVSAEEAGDFVRFTVTDDGPGIAEEWHEAIFEMFRTVNSPGRERSTGIGLALIRKLVLQYGGAVSVRSSPGHGASFFFTWPRRVPGDCGSAQDGAAAATAIAGRAADRAQTYSSCDRTRNV